MALVAIKTRLKISAIHFLRSRSKTHTLPKVFAPDDVISVLARSHCLQLQLPLQQRSQRRVVAAGLPARASVRGSGFKLKWKPADTAA